jgi:hypothetical protein
VISRRPKPISLREGSNQFWVCGVALPEPMEPKGDNTSPKFGDRPGELAVRGYPLLTQPFATRDGLGASRLRTLEEEGDGRPKQSPHHGDQASEPGCHAR